MRDNICVLRSDDISKGGKYMVYSKPQVEIVKFDTVGFMTSSVGYSFQDVLDKIGGREQGAFKCKSIGCSGSVTISGYTFQQNGHGNGQTWHYCSSYNP